MCFALVLVLNKVGRTEREKLHLSFLFFANNLYRPTALSSQPIPSGVPFATYLQERKYCKLFELEIVKMEEASDLPMNLLIGAGCATLVLGSGLAFVMMKSKKANDEPSIEENEEEIEALDPEVSAWTNINFIGMNHTSHVSFLRKPLFDRIR